MLAHRVVLVVNEERAGTHAAQLKQQAHGQALDTSECAVRRTAEHREPRVEVLQVLSQLHVEELATTHTQTSENAQIRYTKEKIFLFMKEQSIAIF